MNSETLCRNIKISLKKKSFGDDLFKKKEKKNKRKEGRERSHLGANLKGENNFLVLFCVAMPGGAQRGTTVTPSVTFLQ